MADKVRDPQFSQNIKRLQRERKIKSAQIASKLGINPQTYSSYARGITSPPFEILAKLKYILDVTWEDLLLPYIPNEYLIETEDERELDILCLKIKKKCKTDNDFKKMLFYFVNIH